VTDRIREEAERQFPDSVVTSHGFTRTVSQKDERFAFNACGDFLLSLLDSDDAREVVAKALHTRNIFEYDECDHGTFRGGAMDGEPYKMCERAAPNVLAAVRAYLKGNEPEARKSTTEGSEGES